MLAAAVTAAAAMVLAACTGSPPSSGTAAHGPAPLAKALAAIEGQSKYRQSDWGYTVLDEHTGTVLISQNDQKMFDPGSTMKTYAVAAALNAYGAGYRFHTPVYRDGQVTGGVLHGNVVLVASGDLSLGLREQPDGSLYYENAPAFNQSYANVGLPGAVEPPGNPLAGLDQLARAVHAAAITRVSGNVVIDDRLFTPYPGFPDGLISPIWVNENLIDVLAKPTIVGHRASISWQPMTASYTVDNQVDTVAAGAAAAPLAIANPTPGKLVVTGQVAAGAGPTLVVHEIDDPAAFARTAFIEALKRAGVTVTAAPTGHNPAALLPAKGSYRPANKIAEHVSATLAQFANLILKVSYNRGADLMACLTAVNIGSTDCQQGLVAETHLAEQLGAPAASLYAFDGAGSDDRDRTTPAALASFLRHAASKPFGVALAAALPVLGRSGTLANVLPKSPAAGHVQVKTGNRAASAPAGQIILLGNSLAGYLQAKTGRHLTFMIAVGNVPISSATGIIDITGEQARMVEDIYQAY